MKITTRFVLPLLTALTACAAVAGGLSCNYSQEPVVISQPLPPAGDDVMAILAPLDLGAQLGEATVVEIGAVQRGIITVVVELEDEKVELEIALAGGADRPPSSRGPYAVFYSLRRTELLNDQDAADLTRALGEVLASNEEEPIPAGLSTYGDSD